METRLNIADIKAKLKAMMTAPIEQAAEEARVLIDDVARCGIEGEIEITDYTCAKCDHKAVRKVDLSKDTGEARQTVFCFTEWRELCAKRGKDLLKAGEASRKVRQAAKA
jgi:hypothetical protein